MNCETTIRLWIVERMRSVKVKWVPEAGQQAVQTARQFFCWAAQCVERVKRPEISKTGQPRSQGLSSLSPLVGRQRRETLGTNEVESRKEPYPGKLSQSLLEICGACLHCHAIARVLYFLVPVVKTKQNVYINTISLWQRTKMACNVEVTNVEEKESEKETGEYKHATVSLENLKYNFRCDCLWSESVLRNFSPSNYWI